MLATKLAFIITIALSLLIAFTLKLQ